MILSKEIKIINLNLVNRKQSFDYRKYNNKFIIREQNIYK